MSSYSIQETDQFLSDVEEIAIWILETNIEQSEDLALRKLDEFQSEIAELKSRLQSFPESGQSDSIQGVRQFPIYNGRYSVKWVVSDSIKLISLISIADSKYPKQLRTIVIDE